MNRSLNYRPEIDGLRAIAVLSVILDHAGVKIFRGGFIGVDIFFVISGFLISSIILKSFQVNSFSLLDFYERRARRILPTLLLVIFCSIPLAWLFMFPAQIIEYAKSIISIIFFSSNFFFWTTHKYFDQISQIKPLLHTWSLGIEEQFYFIFPLCFVFFLKRKSKHLILSLSLFAFLSLFLSEILFNFNKATMNFYLLPSRAWELLLGVILAVINHRKSLAEVFNHKLNNLFSLIGLAMISYSIFFFSSSTAIPGLMGLIPTIGTVLIIGFAHQKTLVGRILTFRPLVFVGLISYSLYLWHQPLFAFGRLSTDNTRALFPWLILLTFLLSVLSYRYVEKPFRNNQFISKKYFFTLMIFSAIVLLAVSLTTIISKGFETRFDKQWTQWSNHKLNANYVSRRARSLDKDFDQNQKKKILIVGDSFSQDLVNEIFENDAMENFQIRTLAILADCQIYYGPYDNKVFIKNKIFCKQMQEQLVDQRIKSADIIIFASAWRDWSAKLLKDTLRRLQLKESQKVIVFGTKHFGKIHFNSLSRLSLQERIALKYDISSESQVQTNKILRKNFQNNIIIPTDLICLHQKDKLLCPLFTPEGKLITYDGSHLTQDGAKFIGQKLIENQKFRSLLN